MGDAASLIPGIKQNQQVWVIRGGVIVASAVGLALALPIIYSAFLAGLGLLGLGIVGAAGAGMIYALPLVGQKLENRILSWRKAEARQNPIEQMQNRLIERVTQLTQFEKALATISGHVSNMRRMIEEEAKLDPDHDLSGPNKSLSAMVAFYNKHLDKLKLAKKAVQEYEKEIKRKSFEWEFAKTGKAAMQSMNAADGEKDIVNKLLTDEAFKEVEAQFDQVFGELEVQTVLDQAAHLESIPEYTPATAPSVRQLGE
jgi:hypothetical protein